VLTQKEQHQLAEPEQAQFLVSVKPGLFNINNFPIGNLASFNSINHDSILLGLDEVEL
jgi:hypothetical protein